MEGNGKIGGNCPRGGGPDDGVEIGIFAKDLIWIFFQLKANVNCGANVFLVHQLGIGERGLLSGTP